MSHDPLFLTSGLLGGLGDLTARFLGLGHGFDDTNSNGLQQVISKCSSYETLNGVDHTCLMSRTAKRPKGG